MNATAQKKIVPGKVLVTGASGLLGVAAIDKFFPRDGRWSAFHAASPSCPAAGTLRFCRRKRPAPHSSPLTDITHIAYTALHEKPELVAGWSSNEHVETNNAMRRNVVEPIVRTASNFQHISILQGTKIYGIQISRPTPG
jgi:hypothetical protein